VADFRHNPSVYWWLLGLIASASGPRGALLALLVLPPLALLCGTPLRDP
jgi:hypothetical protein